MRLDKYLAAGTGLSRKVLHRHLRAGDVSVNGATLRNAAYHLASDDKVSFLGESIQLVGHGYWMLHKPAGYVCTNTDGSHPTVLDLLADTIDPANLQIAGRLDVDTTGLVLITTDGNWNHRITSPRYHCLKRYRLGLESPLSDEQKHQLEKGVMLHGESKPTRPARVERQANGEILMSISEGKYHQIKRMLAAVDNKVISLHREAVGDIELDEKLAAGEFRELTETEIESALQGARARDSHA